MSKNLEGESLTIRFKNKTELEITTGYDEKKDKVYTEDETFEPSETHEVDIVSDHGETVDMQFGCGDMAYAVPKTLFDVVEVL